MWSTRSAAPIKTSCRSSLHLPFLRLRPSSFSDVSPGCWGTEENKRTLKKVKSNLRTLSTFTLKINFFFIVLHVYKIPGGLEQTQLQIHIPAKNELWAVFYGICTELESTDPAQTNGSKFVEKCKVQCQHGWTLQVSRNLDVLIWEERRHTDFKVNSNICKYQHYLIS